MNFLEQHLYLQSSVLFKRKIFNIFYVGFAIFLLIPLHFSNSFYYAKFENSALAKKDQKINGLPIRLKIPNLKINATIEYVNSASDGSMDVPKNIDNVAWFQLGPKPGDIGNAIIAGHRGWLDSKAAIFNNLNNLKKGDIIYIEDNKGILISFVVQKSKIYNPEDNAEEVFNQNSGSHLNLVTCAGAWNDVQKIYDKRLVIFTDILN